MQQRGSVYGKYAVEFLGVVEELGDETGDNEAGDLEFADDCAAGVAFVTDHGCVGDDAFDCV